MAIIIGADKAGTELKDVIKDYLKEGKYEVIDVSENEVRDFVDTTLAVAKEVNASEDNLGIVIDAYGVGSFMVATKIKGMVAAEVSDERSAYMTRGHNNSRIITLGSEISAPGIAKNIVKGFVEGEYDGGRHQVRIDMLNKMC
ncbi:Galactose-6-phosphate isomerase, LacA subunit [Streptococcus dysgalactiae subsp. dysgalactiae]|uniref:Galactose-6-phosphate isomerase subunit LacA n=1 Tax=Streptococcus dysgalactiae subsp. dysgalactiae TaxID=99822 RepID=A0A380JW04_STRDY|nr:MULTISPECIES: galactose-6-phosphate isomerase subunit LacA [Streptococcus]EFY02684.1 galactose-6-phosphate isomerase subunit LacA [Streptococcus dysgalactiae subsp. dysgalactiae ATCC 27957]MCB2835684.1 galactose-6-phosphate isomerase subunit LacA [Streptococcus dysgalactiae subsp. dysgalactiae]SUN49058.1 Galactose-6-phosphate isomerase, LacA subunit [Streptococcus dysgalactiae subsp. dysgalactiae]HEO0884353.1 galactose-6-phosphate isomerase subunit LacA [Streptococcus agalactiae]HEO4332748.